MKDGELFVSVDVETDGPIPREYSMLSLGSAVFDPSGEILGEFEVNLKKLHGAKEDNETMEWWKTEPKAWEYCRRNQVEPHLAMNSYLAHLKQISNMHQKGLVCIGYPVTFDFMFVYWYLIKFTGESPFSFSGLDIKTMAMLLMKSHYKEVTKKSMPRRWFVNVEEHSHTSLQDAKAQGRLFCNMLNEFYAKDNKGL